MLTPVQRALFAERIAGKHSGSHQPGIAHHSNLEQVPLSYNQEQIWLEEQITASPGLYSRPLALRLTGPIDKKALQLSIERLVQRHAILRTTFPIVGGKPIQHIHPPVPEAILSHIDLSRCDAEDREFRLRELIERKTRQFDLAHKPPFDPYLICLTPEVHVLYFAIHHIIFDAWSANILTRDLFDLYKFAVGQKNDPPADLTVQYADFALWQRGENCWDPAGLAFWKDRFSREVPVLELPVSHHTAGQTSYQGKSIDFYLPPETADAFRALCLGEGATLYMGLLAVFALLLSRLSGQTDLVIGTPVAGRSLPETHALIGVFINMLPMRCDLSGRPTFRQLLDGIREESLQAFTHQDLPYEVLVRNLRLAAGENQRGPVSVVFQLRNIPGVDVELENLQIEEIQAVDDSARFNLVLDMHERDGALEGQFTYRRDLFDEATISRWIKHFATLISRIISSPDVPAVSLPLLDEGELRQVSEKWNATAADYPHQGVPSLFEAQCNYSPDAPAIYSSGEAITYEELNRRANRLAHFLLKCGVGSGSIVGLCLERSIETVVTMLGILKSGGVYLPLDPTYPAVRLAYMLEDAECSALVTKSELEHVLPPTKAHVICLDRDWPQIALGNEENLNFQVEADDPAYLMYTSGSTGSPKGVLVPHHAINRLVLNTNYLQIKPEDRLAHVSNISFDASTFEIWGALLNGAKLIVVPREILLTPGSLARELKNNEVSILFLTTALFNQLVRQVPEALNSLRCLLFGGEQADVGAVRHLLRFGRPQNLVHVYGPTENTTFSTWYPVNKVGEGDLAVPIGRAIANTSAYILDEDLNPLPPGVAGELHLAGDGLALEYWKDAELTHTKFIANPFSQDPNARLYRTGDTCRYQPDGNIIFTGRKDQQIKLRGHRIELGEISAVLKKLPHIKDCVTVQHKSSSGEVRIACYVVVDSNKTVSMRELRGHLANILPGYMLPHTITDLAEIPLTANGKIDFSSLPPPPEEQAVDIDAYTPPQSATEKVLAEIWNTLLDHTHVGREDNFFDLGGHSLLVVSLCAHIEEKLGVSLSFSEVYQQPTLYRLAALVDQSQIPAAQSTRPGATFFWCGNGFDLMQKHFHSPGWLYRLPLPAEDGKRMPKKSLPVVAAEYIKIIKSIQAQGPYYLGGFSFGGLAVYEVAQQLTAQGDNVKLLFLLEPAQNQRRSALNVLASPGSSETQTDMNPNGMQRKPADLRKGLNIGPRVYSLVQFVWQKIKNQLVYNNGSLVKLIRYQWYLVRDGMVPASLRSDYITHTWNRIISGYHPRAYPGEAVLLLSEGSGKEKSLPIRQVNKVRIPGAQSHTDPVFGGYSAFWIDNLSTHLDRFKIL